MKTNITYRERKKGNWQYIISYKDETSKWKQKGKQGFEKKSLAKEAAELDLKKLKKELIEIKKLDENYKEITFKEFIDIFIKNLKLHREPNTVISYSSALSHFKTLNDLKLININNTDIQNCIDSMVKRNLKTTTIDKYLKLIVSFFNSAVKQYKIIYKNPIENINFPLTKTKAKRNVLSIDRYNELIKEFEGTNFYIVLLLAGSCGLRVGEILGLTWDNVDTENKLLIIEKQWKKLDNGSYGFSSLKSTNSYRIIPLSSELINKIEEYKNIWVKNENDRLVFYSPGSLSSNLNRKLKKYNLTIHTLRHGYATALVSNEVDFKTAAKILGHDITQTMKTYSHVTDEMMKNAANKIDDIFK